MQFYQTRLKQTVQETSSIYSYIMDIPAGYAWQAGQHAAWQFRGFDLAPDDREIRVFTIASAPEDGYLMFTTRIGEKHTSLKEALLHQIRPGHPIGVADPLGGFGFHPETHRHTLMIAGGVGVTPIRSVLRHYLEKSKEGHKITVLYSDSDREYAYPAFWEEVRKRLPGVELFFVSERDSFVGRADAFARTHAVRQQEIFLTAAHIEYITAVPRIFAACRCREHCGFGLVGGKFGK